MSEKTIYNTILTTFPSTIAEYEDSERYEEIFIVLLIIVDVELVPRIDIIRVIPDIGLVGFNQMILSVSSMANGNHSLEEEYIKSIMFEVFTGICSKSVGMDQLFGVPIMGTRPVELNPSTRAEIDVL